MEREIKFRAYHPKVGMFDVYGLNDHYVYMDCLDSTILGENMFERKECILMQYTGLKDKNGKEIYEGDIVKWGMHKGSEESYHRYAIVEINADIQFRIIFYINSKTGERKQTDNHIFRFGNFAYKDTQKHLEIIGNIHDNPELLEQ